MALPTIPSEGGSPPRRLSILSHEASSVSIPSIAIPDSIWERERRNERESPMRPPIVIRNPWISTTSLGSSAFLHRDSDFSSLASATRPNTSDSHDTVVNLAKTLPSWARSFYGSGERSVLFPRYDQTSDSRTGSVSRPTTTNTAPTQSPASSQFSIQAVHRPRTRPHTLTMSQIPTSEDSYITEIGGPMYAGPNHEPTLDLATPRLPRDKCCSAVMGEMRPNSLMIGKGAERQVVMFCIGFVMPLSWVVAAFLPIPPRPVFYVPTRDGNEKEVAQGVAATGGLHEAVDVEQAITERLEPLMRDHLRARWWRNLNRVMSLVGLIIVAVVVAVAAALG
ncbi:hypothetical protein K490DRAFT_68435 [Saccharata proteae CBS 121410]|uniref:Serine-rich protein n=1 Tax=Saccharata proteae CBS 121410 TaxID=1314787 RepID=A0A9P4LW29_9PEZI|nr:hypothetical protein K490DRAFT_68435 [Saccharata proteae CBS 121410]